MSHTSPRRAASPMRRLAPLVALVATIMALTGACSSIDCPVENTVSTVYGLYKAGGERDTLRDTLTIATTRRDGVDSVLLNRMVNFTQFELPISYNAPADTLYFAMSGASGRVSIDTVRVAKDNTPHFESVDCAAAYFHYITSVSHTRHAIDSIVINKANVDYDATTEHLHIYLRPRN